MTSLQLKYGVFLATLPRPSNVVSITVKPNLSMIVCWLTFHSSSVIKPVATKPITPSIATTTNAGASTFKANILKGVLSRTVVKNSAPKYTTATAETIVKTFLVENSCCGESNNDEYNKLDLSDNKIVCKNIKAVKNDIISIINKYFGKNSEFGALDIMNKII